MASKFHGCPSCNGRQGECWIIADEELARFREKRRVKPLYGYDEYQRRRDATA
ncbi:MAG TPA: hypothetical protein VLZ05_27745 [Mycobacterium sp.]|nr:hypothetical protein [Mycobacterium sp.]HUH72316.1 hypothetical protein [Mycobacterium sp.]